MAQVTECKSVAKRRLTYTFKLVTHSILNFCSYLTRF